MALITPRVALPTGLTSPGGVFYGSDVWTERFAGVPKSIVAII